MTASARERAALVATLRTVGPDAPTLCGEWSTRDLAAHLILREHRPDASAGILFPPLAAYTARLQQRVASTDWNDLLDKVAAGPPLYSPWRLLDPLVNTAEMFIHHEDVRRARPNWQPRLVDEGTAAALRRMLPVIGRLTLRRAPARVVLRDPDGTTRATFGSGPEVPITGPPTELTLFLSGRDAVELDFAGSDDAIAAVRAARRGL